MIIHNKPAKYMLLFQLCRGETELENANDLYTYLTIKWLTKLFTVDQAAFQLCSVLTVGWKCQSLFET